MLEMDDQVIQTAAFSVLPEGFPCKKILSLVLCSQPKSWG